MKRAPLLALALAVIPVAVDAQVPPSPSCADLSLRSPLEDVRTCAEQGDPYAQAELGFMYAVGEGVPADDVFAYMWANLAAAKGFRMHRKLKTSSHSG
jgi:TPR repeat protein